MQGSELLIRDPDPCSSGTGETLGSNQTMSDATDTTPVASVCCGSRPEEVACQAVEGGNWNSIQPCSVRSAHFRGSTLRRPLDS